MIILLWIRCLPASCKGTFKNKEYMYSKTLILFILGISLCYNNHFINHFISDSSTSVMVTEGVDGINPYKTVKEIPLPSGFVRVSARDLSFSGWLISLPLKKDKTVYLFNRMPKQNQAAQFAVLDITVGNTDLQQCADAVMRLRAEYLFAVKNFQEIHFWDNDGKLYQFNKPYNSEGLQAFLKNVFGMCGSASLSKQLHPISLEAIEPGDVLIRGGFPGHAVIVMDVAKNKEGKKIYLLAQSYMPAQDIHLLINPNNKILSPWYEVNSDPLINTPEYIFKKGEIKRW